MTNANKKRFFNLSHITSRIQQILQPHVGKLFWVKAEISSGRERGGSFYCDLVETDDSGRIIAQMRCTIWNRELASIRRRFKEYGLDLQLDDGIAVGLQCSIQYHPQYGLSLTVVGADPAFALGELELKKKEILDRLIKEGLQEPNKRLQVPMLPQKIGLITSKGSAACNDILMTFTSSGFGFKIYLADSIVQGLQAEKSVLDALDILEKLNIELVIIARGGGSKTDLFYLENEAVARRIAGYRHPVWTGIGHETDISILDHVANEYFKTPTAVAEEIVARFVEVKHHLEEAENRFRSSWSYRFDKDRRWLDKAEVGIVQGTKKLLDTTKSILMSNATTLSSKVQYRLTNENSRIAIARSQIAVMPVRQISDKQKDLLGFKKRFQLKRFLKRIQHEDECIADWRDRFLQCFRSEIYIRKQKAGYLSSQFRLEPVIAYLENEKIKLANKSATLRAADPTNSLKRGFSLVFTKTGNLLKSLTQVQPRDILRTEISDGYIESTVNSTERKQDA